MEKIVNFIIQENRIYLEDAENKVLAEVTFLPIGKNTVNVNHTFVDDSLRGQGIASKLMEAMAKKMKQENKKMILTCSYAINWFEKHVEYADLVTKHV